MSAALKSNKSKTQAKTKMRKQKQSDAHGDRDNGEQEDGEGDVTKKRTATADNVGSVDALAIEQLAEYAARMNKWRRHVILTVNDKLFGKLVNIMGLTRSPLIHLSSFLKKSRSEHELDLHGSSLHSLVCFKAIEIKQEFDSLFSGSAQYVVVNAVSILYMFMFSLKLCRKISLGDQVARLD